MQNEFNEQEYRRKLIEGGLSEADATDLAAAGSGRLIANAGRRCTAPADVLYSRAGAAPPRARPNACMTRVAPLCDALRRSP